MAKFKVGDRVRILDGSQIVSYTGKWDALRMSKYVGNIMTISGFWDYYDGRTTYYMKDTYYVFDERGLELIEEESNKRSTKNTYMPEIIDYNYNENTAVTNIKWSDGTKTSVRAEDPNTANQYSGFVAAYAKKAAGNNNTINKLFDEWAVNKPAREMKAQIKANAAALEKRKIAEKRKAKREKWLIRKEAIRIKREYEAKKLAAEKYDVPIGEE